MGNSQGFTSFDLNEPQSDIYNHQFINILGNFIQKEANAKNNEFLEHDILQLKNGALLQLNPNYQLILKCLYQKTIEEYKGHCNHWETRTTKIVHNNVIQLHAIFKTDNSQGCSQGQYKIGLLVDQIGGNLQDEMLSKQNYKEEEIWVIIDSIVAGLSFLQQQGYRHSYLRFQTIYIIHNLFSQKVYKVADEQLMNYPSLYSEVRNDNKTEGNFLSPALLQGLINNEFQVSHNSFKSDVFTFGMILLQICLWSPSAECYDWQQKTIREHVFFQKINMVREKYSPELWNFIQESLNMNEQHRPDWVQLDQKLNQYPQLMGKRIAQLQPQVPNLFQSLPQPVQAGQPVQGQQQPLQQAKQVFQGQQLEGNQMMNNSQQFAQQNNSVIRQGQGAPPEQQLNPLDAQQQQLQQTPVQGMQDQRQNGSFQQNQQQQSVVGGQNSFQTPQQQFQNSQQNSFLNTVQQQNQQSNLFSNNQNNQFQQNNNNNFNNQYGNNLNNNFNNNNTNQYMNQTAHFQDPSQQQQQQYGQFGQNNYNQFDNQNNFMQTPQQNQFSQNQNQFQTANRFGSPWSQMPSAFGGTPQQQMLTQMVSQMAGQGIAPVVIMNSTQPVTQLPHQKHYSPIKSITGQEKARIKYNDMSKYEGEVLNGLRDGWGTLTFADGAYIEGQWDQDKVEGKARLFNKDKTIAYEGDWSEDQLHGLGHLYNKEKQKLNRNFDYSDFGKLNNYWSKYEGQFVADKKEGFGVLTLTNGEKFSGCFVADNVHGYGTFTKLNKQVVKGTWVNNKLDQESEEL